MFSAASNCAVLRKTDKKKIRFYWCNYNIKLQNKMKKGDKIIIVGGNAAGPAAAAKAKRVNPDAEIILFEAGNFISTGTCEIPYVLSKEIKNTEDIIFFTPEEFYRQKGVKVFVNHLVEEINTKEKFVKVQNIRTGAFTNYYYDKLILTTGSSSKKDILAKDSVNSFTLKNISDLVQIKEFIGSFNVKNVSIIGAGFIGLETAEALVNIGCTVSLIEKSSMPFPSAELESQVLQKEMALVNIGCTVSLIEKSSMPFPSAEPEIQVLIKELLVKNSITFYSSAEIKPIINQNKITAININGRIVETELVINAIGILPNVYLAVKANLKIGTTGALKVDTRLRTSDFNCGYFI